MALVGSHRHSCTCAARRASAIDLSEAPLALRPVRVHGAAGACLLKAVREPPAQRACPSLLRDVPTARHPLQAQA
eukprot:5037479-Alexandrium_andersonii.AAC.1